MNECKDCHEREGAPPSPDLIPFCPKCTEHYKIGRRIELQQMMIRIGIDKVKHDYTIPLTEKEKLMEINYRFLVELEKFTES